MATDTGHLPAAPSGGLTPSTSGMAIAALRSAVAAFEHHRGHRALLYFADDQQPASKQLDEADITAFYDALLHLGPTDHLDLIINSPGGSITAARRILQLLHHATGRLTIHVPYKAHSAGTLLALGADELLMSPAAGLSPIDPQIFHDNATYSSLDIAALTRLPPAWLGDQPDATPAGNGAALAAGLPPLTLARFHRAEQLIRTVATEALHANLPDAPPETLAAIAEQLITGYHDHNFPLGRDDLTAIGVNVTRPTPTEETLLWAAWKTGRHHLSNSPTPAHDRTPYTRTNAVLTGSDYTATHELRRVPVVAGDANAWTPESGWKLTDA